MQTLMDIIEILKKNSMDNNISYKSVDMFWKVGDCIANKQKAQTS